MLPEPDIDAKRQSQRLCRDIRRRIAASGRIGFDKFMELALFAPCGYYNNTARKFGRGGDFITAPLMGAVLAKCLARQCAEVLAQFRGGDVMEFGAGDGHLAVEILRAMDLQNCPPDRYFILDTAAVLRARQQEKIATLDRDLRARVKWLDRLPDEFNGVILGNEVLDAMPAIRFEMDASGNARALDVVDDMPETGGDDAPQQHGFAWGTGAPLPASLQTRLAKFELPCGYRSEMGLQAEAWMRAVGEIVNRGVILLIDYGFPRREFYHPQRNAGTLMCHYRHRAHDDPFFYPGLQDISVHIDFTAITQAAHEVGLSLAGYTSQAAFLLSLGALDALAELAELAELDGGQTANHAVAAEIKKLTLPHEMGELFKVIAFAKNYAAPLRGFAITDRRAALA